MPEDSSVEAGPNPSQKCKPQAHPALVFAVVFVVIFLLHAPLLQLPYFWDEAGYYVPAARDILLSGSLIPHSTVSNAHPPLVLAWVALWWKAIGYTPLVARSAMLVVAAFSLTGLFRLAECVANTEVAIVSTLCTAFYPVFFAQSTLVQVDLAAAGLTFWGFSAYLEDKPIATASWFTLAVLTKETAILATLALAAWELLCVVIRKRERGRSGGRSGEGLRAGSGEKTSEESDRRAALQGRVSRIELLGALAPAEAPSRRVLSLAFPVLPLALWYAYHYARTGYVFGNPEFFRYNVASTINPVRFLLAFAVRAWQVFGYLHLWLLTMAMMLAMMLPPQHDRLCEGKIERSRIALPVQMVFFVVIAAYMTALSLIGGAELARYMLPAVPLVIILAVSTLRRRLRYWIPAVGAIAAMFIAAWFWNPPYGFSPEDNLAYRDFIVLHENAEQFLEARYPMAHVLTAWPASGELSSPWLGYVTRSVQVVQIEYFSLDELLSAADFRQNFDVALVFSTKYQPPHPWLDRWKKWTDLKQRFFGFHRDLPPAAAAEILGGNIVFAEERKGQWVAVIQLEREEIQNAERILLPANLSQNAAVAHNKISPR